MEHLKTHSTSQIYYKISPSYPLKAQHPLKVSQKSSVAHLSLLTTKSELEEKENPDALAILRNLCSPGLATLIIKILHIETDCKIHTVD